MKKYILPAVLLAAGFSLSTIGFQKQEIKAAEESGTEVEETEWELQTFVQEDMLIDGELAMDDRGHFLIQVSSGEDSYVMFDDTVQLGIPEADAWIDDQEKLHIVVRDVRTARYRVTDFTYDSEKKEFVGNDVLNGDGINYLGTTGK